MIRTMKIFTAACLMFLAAAVFAQEKSVDKERIVLGTEVQPKDTTKERRFVNHLIAPKGEWQCGLSVMYADFDTQNSDYMMLLQGVDANASILRLAPEAAYTFADNHAVGARIQYTNVNGMLDGATADLLGNFSMSVEDLNAVSRSMSGCIFQRTYIGLDNRGRVGIFWDYVLGYTRTKTQFFAGEPTDAFSLTNKVHLGFAPGLVYFPMNNVSVQFCIGLADLSYSRVSANDGTQMTGVRHLWSAKAGLNLMNLSFGVTVHL